MIEHAPGAPGIPPTWTSSAKDMVGCALGSSRLWFTLGFGIVNEVYYPRVDTPQEAEYFRNGGILPFVLRQLAAQ